MATSILAATRGYGFSWFVEEKIRDEIRAGLLKRLPLAEGNELFADFYLVFRDAGSAGPGTLRLAKIIEEGVAAGCTKERKRRTHPQR
jgi:DNA-binding transcriptional LysR family regulator